jgi:hypothetical protein
MACRYKLLRQEIGFAQQPRVPVRGPALVHDLAGEDRVEVVGLFAHGQENVALPVFQLGRVVGNKPQQVGFRLRRQRRALQWRITGRRRIGLAGQARSGRGIHWPGVRWRRHELGVGRTVQRLVDVDVGFQRQRGVKHGFDPLLAMRFERPLKAVGAAALCSRIWPPAIDMKRVNSWLFLAKSAWPSTWAVTRVFSASEFCFKHEGMARVAGEHDLENFGMPHVLAHQLVDVAHAERPVPHPHRQAIHGDLDHEIAGTRSKWTG